MKKNYSLEATKDLFATLLCSLMGIGCFLNLCNEFKENDTWGIVGYGLMMILFVFSIFGGISDFFDNLTSAIAEKSKKEG